MRSVHGLTVGWIDSGIGPLIELGLLSRFSFVLVTCVDSITNLSTSIVGARIIEQDPSCTFLGSGIVIPGSSISGMSRTLKLFNGFDEVWGFEQKPTKPKPDDFCIMPPLKIEEEEISQSLAS